MYWSLDKGYLVYLFSVTYTFSTETSLSYSQTTWRHSYGTTKVLVWHFRIHKDKIRLFPRLEQSGYYPFLRSKVSPKS